VADLATLLAPNPRIRDLKGGLPDPEGHCVVYWMQRSQRGIDNQALNHAIKLANSLKLPVVAMFGLTPRYPEAERRHYRFLVDGLADTHAAMEARGVPFVVRVGKPNEVMERFATEVRAAIVVGDENPVRVGQHWRNTYAEVSRVPYRVVDADVVVPSSLFPKEEWAARTIRIKIHKVWDEYLKPVANPKAQVRWKEGTIPTGDSIETEVLMAQLKIGGVGEVVDYKGGSVEALSRLQRFIKHRLPVYATERNEPTPYQTTELSAHLHFGHISPLTIALGVMASDAAQESKDSLLEELIVRRELSINYVSRNPAYDTLEGCPDWALKTLAKHASDRRPVLYTAEQLEAGETGDPLWNASQKEMVLTGRMHNYLRMYWAKKILEWTPDPATAFAITLRMNDRYEMDGRDPNGYTGVAWAIGGKHDRPWGERPIFGTVRFMSYESTRKKFDSAAYIKRVANLEK
jgi:deoxyribodipyrimidine photo-lyase